MSRYSVDKALLVALLTGYKEVEGHINEDVEEQATGQHKVYTLKPVGISKSPNMGNIVNGIFEWELKMVYNADKEFYDDIIEDFDDLTTSISQSNAFISYTSDISIENLEDYCVTCTARFKFGYIEDNS